MKLESKIHLFCFPKTLKWEIHMTVGTLPSPSEIPAGYTDKAVEFGDSCPACYWAPDFELPSSGRVGDGNIVQSSWRVGLNVKRQNVSRNVC